MNQVVEERDVFIQADAWAQYNPQVPELPSSALDAMVAQFLATGGQIHQIAPGVSAAPAGATVTDSRSLFTPEEQRAHREDKHLRKAAGDQAYIPRIDEALATETTAIAIRLAAGCSADKLQRLLALYFAHDPRADRFRQLDWDERNRLIDQELIPRIKDAVASGMVGIQRIAQYLGACTKTVVRLNKQHKLNVPKGTPGKKRVMQ